MRNGQGNNFKMIIGGLLRRASGATLGFGTSLTVLLTATAIAAVAIGTAAWLSSNRSVDSDSMAMDMGDMFDLGVPSVQDPNDNTKRLKSPKLSDANWTLKTPYGAVISTGILNDLNLAADGYGIDEHDVKTGAASGVICALYVEPKNVGTQTNPVYEQRFRPGATGTLTFYVYPKQTGQSFEGTLSLLAVGKQLEADGSVVKDNSGRDLYEFISETANSTEIERNRAAAVELMKGHVLFFADASRTKWIKPGDSFLISGTTGTNANGYAVTIYWMWPLKYSDLEQKVTRAFVSAHESMFLLNGSIAEGKESAGYDNADTSIGVNISHMFAQIMVAPAENTARYENSSVNHTVTATPN